ncbi:hypothetical protein AAIA72_10295 [Hahella sp. SMD15-11]|uniref:Uncharacterized protein n=1 Tax=Thermohahella caldifontis TaxID=3142973 RepID=A0AB39UTM4_9GAMM
MSPVHQADKLQKLYESKLNQLQKAAAGQNTMLKLILEAEVQALADQLRVTPQAH